MRRQRFHLLLVLALLAGPLVQPARAGGWWSTIVVEGPYLGAGETVPVRAEFLFPSIAAAERAQRSGEYYAYVVRGIDRRALDRAVNGPQPKQWWTPPSEIYRSGTVRLSGFDGNFAVARARVTVPDLPPGRYSVMLCTDGCTDPLGDVVPTGVRVTRDASLAATARGLAAELDRMDLKESRARHELRQSVRRSRDLRDRLSAAERKIEDLRERVRDLAVAPRADNRAGPGGSAAYFLLGLVAGGAIALGGRGVSRRRARIAPVAARR
jgi:hypothetical protein